MAIEVSTCAELQQAINVQPSHSSIQLKNDIECGDYTFIPAADIVFTGHFDGRGYAINNLTISGNETSSHNAGLFENVNTATIENVTFNNTRINFTNDNFQNTGLLGSYLMESTVKNVTVKNFDLSYDGYTARLTVLSHYAIYSEFDNILIEKFNINFEKNYQIFNVGTIASDAMYTTINNAVITDGNIGNKGFSSANTNYNIGGMVGSMQDVSITNSSVSNVIIGLSSSEWNGKQFGGVAGSAEGNNVIDNVQVDASIYGWDLTGGLVGDSQNVDDLKISNSHFRGNVFGYQEVGGLVGKAINTSIVGSSASETVEGRYAVGGLVGNAYKVTIENSYSNNRVYAYDTNGNRTGGIIGVAYSGVTIDQSYSSSDVSSDNNQNVGGLIGIVESNVIDVVISNSYFDGRVEGPDYVGGLVGKNIGADLDIINSYAVGSIRSSGLACGLVCTYNSDPTVYVANSYWDIEATGHAPDYYRDGGEGKTTSQMKNQNTYINWDFNTIWQPINSNEPDYPQLQYFVK